MKILKLRNFKCSTTPEVPNLFGTTGQFCERRQAGWGGAGRAQGSGGDELQASLALLWNGAVGDRRTGETEFR